MRAPTCHAVAGLACALLCAPLQAQRPDEDTLARIQQIVGTARCSSEDQCRTVGLGSRPCGGSERYLAWSTVDTDARELAELAARYAEQRRALNEASGRLGTCQILPEPGVRCERPAASGAGRCVLVPGAGAQVR